MAKLLYPKSKWNGKTIALDDGHGKQTPGKRTPYIKSLGRQIHENEFNEAVVNALAELLLDAGFRVLLVAPTDADTSLSARTNAANANKCDLYVSVHYDAIGNTFDYSTASGNTIYIYPGHRNKDAGKLADAVGKHLKEGTAQKWRGIKEADFHVLRETNMPAILTENGFMDDEKEALLMVDKEFQREVADEHFRGILDFYGMKVETKPESKPAPSKPAPKPAPSKPKPAPKQYTSIVAYLSDHKRDSSFKAREKLAKEYGISGYKGTAAQNLKLLDLLQSGAKPKPKPASKPSSSLPNAVYRASKPYPTGAGVKAVQKALASVYFYPDKGAPNNGIDGVYGPKTADAVRRFQLIHGLTADGIYGPKTKAALEKARK